MVTATSAHQSVLHCPECGRAGSRVARKTLANLLRDEPRTRIGDEAYSVCSTPGCGIVYFDDSGSTIEEDELRVPFGLKGGPRPRTVCYCFDHTIEDIDAEIERSGRSTVVERIQGEMKTHGCRCETMNPLGACCLRSVSAIVATAMNRSGAVTDKAVEGRRASGAARWGWAATVGSVVAAVLSTACCWLPLLLLGVGLSAAGVAGFLESWRWPLVGLAALLLGVGFFQAYRPHAASEADCCRAAPRSRRFQRTMLWTAAAFVVAMLWFPGYAKYVLPPTAVGNAALLDGRNATRLVVPVRGMTCDGCAAPLAESLAALSGVSSVEVDVARNEARILVAADTGQVRRSIVAAVVETGFEASLNEIRGEVRKKGTAQGS